MTANDIREYRQYLKQCSDQQIQEFVADRLDYVELVIAEAERRGLTLTTK